MKTSKTHEFKTMVSRLPAVVTLGVFMLYNSRTLADENDCAAIAPPGSVAPLSASTAQMKIVYDSPEVIEIEVDCWHVGHCDVCDEYADYDCSPYGSYGGYMEYNYGIDDGWEPCPFLDPIPSGNILTKIEATVYGIGCPGWGGSMMSDVFVNEEWVGSGIQEGSCDCGSCYPLTVASAEYPNGFPGYVYGGANYVYLDIQGVTCFSDVHLRLYYSPHGLKYEWIPPDPPEALMGRNYIIQLNIHNPTEEIQTGFFSFSQEVSSTSGPFGWDAGWQESILLDGSPYAESSTVTVQVPASETLEYYFTINNKWNWIEPYSPGRLLDIALGLLLSWPGLETISLTYTTISTLFTYVEHVGQVGYLYTGTGDGVPTQFQVTVSVPYEKYVLDGESILAGILAGKLTSAGIAALFVPGAGWAVAGPLFAAQAIEIAAGEVLYALAVDPDPEYMEVAYPTPIIIPAVDALDESAGKEAVLAALDAISYLRATLASYAKYEGAEDAADVAWMAVQLDLSKQYLAQASSCLDTASYLLGSVVAMIPVPEDEDIDMLRDWIIVNGLPQIEVDVLLALGYTPDEIDVISQAMAYLPENAFILFPDSAQVFANMANGLTEVMIAMPSPPKEVVYSTVDFDPDTLNLESMGNWLTCYIELPGGLDVKQIDISTVTVSGSVPALQGPTRIGDYDSDGIPDLMAKFDRSALIDVLRAVKDREKILLALTGRSNDGTWIVGNDTVNIINRP